MILFAPVSHTRNSVKTDFECNTFCVRHPLPDGRAEGDPVSRIVFVQIQLRPTAFPVVDVRSDWSDHLRGHVLRVVGGGQA